MQRTNIELQLHDIHEKVLSFARQLVPVNKAQLVSFFASGSGRARYIARHLAYCLLVPASITPNVCFYPLPPMQQLEHYTEPGTST